MTGPLRIAHVHPVSLDLFGHRDEQFGTDVRYAVSNLAREQARLGHRPTVHLLTRTGRPRRLSYDGVEVRFHRFVGAPARSRLELQFARQVSLTMIREVRRSTTDIVHFHGACSLHTMLIAISARASLQRLPLVAHEHGLRSVGPVVAALQRSALRRAAAALAGSEESEHIFRASGLPESRVHLVTSGVDLELFRPGAATTRSPAQPFVVLHVSRLAEEKDPLTLADAVCRLAERSVPVHLRVLGSGPLQREMAGRLSAAGVPAEFLAYVPHAELAGIYREANAVALTSVREGSNQAVLEAMASGIPVVATNIPGIRAVTRDAAILVPPRDANEFANALERLAGDEAHWHERRALGLRRADALSWEAVAGRVDGIYCEALEHRRAPSRMPEVET